MPVCVWGEMAKASEEMNSQKDREDCDQIGLATRFKNALYDFDEVCMALPRYKLESELIVGVCYPPESGVAGNPEDNRSSKTEIAVGASSPVASI